MNKNILATFKKIFKRKKVSGFSFGNDPREDWKKILISVLILNLLIIAWSGYLFWQINRGDIFQVASTPRSGADASTRTSLKNIIDVYDGKNKQFEELRLARPVSTDPAI